MNINSSNSQLIKLFLFFASPFIIFFSIFDLSYVIDISSIIFSNFIFWSFIIIAILSSFINFLYYKSKVFIIELIIQILASFVLTFSLFFLFFNSSSLKDISIFNGKINQVIFEEPWTEEYSVEVCSGEGSNRTCHTEIRTQRHSSLYFITTSNNERVLINSARFNNFQNLYKNKYEVKLHRTNQTYSSKLRGEGDKWVIIPTTVFPTSVEHTVINYIKVSKRTLLNKGINKNLEPVLPYPSVSDNGYGNISFNRILKSSNISLNTFKFNRDLNILLATYGKSREVNIIVYFTSNFSSSFPKQVEKKWGTWKKNDVVIFIDINSEKIPNINRVYVEAFTKHSLFKIELRDKIYNLKTLNLDNLFKVIKEQISISPKQSNGFKRTSMEEFKYLINEIEIPVYWWFLFILFSFLINLGISYFVRNN